MRRALRLGAAFFVGTGVCHAQGEARDMAALLAFKDGGDPNNDLTSSWTTGSTPCGVGWDDSTQGWVGVVCDVEGGRVIRLSGGGGGGG
eukprot:COSAG03_NODE_9805_length_692_cov_1.414840_1_plen_88_part_01